MKKFRAWSKMSEASSVVYDGRRRDAEDAQLRHELREDTKPLKDLLEQLTMNAPVWFLILLLALTARGPRHSIHRPPSADSTVCQRSFTVSISTSSSTTASAHVRRPILILA